MCLACTWIGGPFTPTHHVLGPAGRLALLTAVVVGAVETCGGELVPRRAANHDRLSDGALLGLNIDRAPADKDVVSFLGLKTFTDGYARSPVAGLQAPATLRQGA